MLLEQKRIGMATLCLTVVKETNILSIMELNLNDCNQSINPTVSFLPNDSLCALSEEQYLGKEGSVQTHTQNGLFSLNGKIGRREKTMA